MRKLIIASEVLDVLKRATISDRAVFLPPERLDRSLYEQVNKVLMNAGGKWDKRAKCHTFTADPRSELGLVVDGGAMEVEKRITEKQEYQAFFTPLDLAEEVVAVADVRGMSVLEPSAGHGALADACRLAECKSVYCVELHAGYAAVLHSKGYGVSTGDFLAIPPEPTYDRIVMNPPFTKNQDIKHVDHAIQFLKPGGRLVAIMAGNTNRRWFNELEFEHEIKELEAGAFKSSGTNVRTIMLTVHF